MQNFSCVRWTKQEVTALIDGYQKYKQYKVTKPGIWGRIMKDVDLSIILRSRNVHTLDQKWNNLVKHKDSRVQHLFCDQFS